MTFGSTLNSDMTSRARASRKRLALRGQYTSTSATNLDEGDLPDATYLSLMDGHSGIQGPTSLEGTMESVCIRRDGEVGVYLDIFEVGLRFPLDEDLAIILRHYRLLLCCYSLSTITLMIVFLPLIRTIEVTFSLSLFRHI